MFQVKVVLFGTFTVLVLSAVVAASASADSCNGGTHWVFCTSPGNLPIHNLAVIGKGGLSVLASKIGAVEIRTSCTDSLFAGTLHLLGLAEGEIVFLDCTSEKPANCVVPSLILAFVHIQMESATKGIATGNKAGGTQEFTEMEESGTGCAIAGKYKITGTQEVEFPKGGEGEIEHEIIAKKAGSKLKFGAETTSFSSIGKVHLESNEAWLITAGE